MNTNMTNSNAKRNWIVDSDMHKQDIKSTRSNNKKYITLNGYLAVADFDWFYFDFIY